MPRSFLCLLLVTGLMVGCEDTSGPSTVPDPPENVLTTLSRAEIQIVWHDVATNESFYLVEVSVDGGPFLTHTQTLSNASSAKYADPEPAREYRFRVSACNRAGCSPPVEVSANTLSWIKPSIQAVNASPAAVGTAVVTVNALTFGHDATVLVVMQSEDNSYRVFRTEQRAPQSGVDGKLFTKFYFSGLIPGITYRYYASVTTRYGTALSELRTFVAADFTPPLLSDVAVTNITATSVVVNARVHPGGTDTRLSITVVRADYTDRRTVSDTILAEPSTGERVLRPVSYTITGLQPGTEYYAYATAANRGGTIYGRSEYFRTLP